MKTVITAGGKGTRISSLFSGIPKPMIDIAGRPVLEHEIACLKSQGFDDIIITVSHLAGRIMNYFGSGEQFGVKIDYFTEREPLGTAGALFLLRERLREPFLLINGDIMFDVDVMRFVEYHRNKGGLATLFTHPNKTPPLNLNDIHALLLPGLTKPHSDRRPAVAHILTPSPLR